MVANEEVLEDLLSSTLMKGNRLDFINQLNQLKIDPKILENLEPFADKNIGKLLAKIKASNDSKKKIGELEDYLKVVSKDKTFSEVFNMSSLEGNALTESSLDQVNKFVVPMKDMEQRIQDIVKNAIKEEINYKQSMAVSQFSDEDCDDCEECCPDCGKNPCECGEPADGRSCAAGIGIDPEAIKETEPSTKIDQRVDDLEEAFSQVANILDRLSKNFDDGEEMGAGVADDQTNVPESEDGSDEKSKAYYDGFNTAKKLEDEATEEKAEELAEQYGYKEGSEDRADFVQGYMEAIGGTTEHSDLYYDENENIFYSDDGDEFYYSDEYGVYSDVNGNILCYSEDLGNYYTESSEQYFSNINDNNFSEVNDNMKNVDIFFSEQDNCFYSEFGERLDYSAEHKAYVGENGSVYFSEQGPYMDSVNFSNIEPEPVNFSSNEKVALFSEDGTAIISYSEVDEDGSLICYSADGRVFVRDNENGCYFSGDGDIYFDSEDIEEAQAEMANGAPTGAYDQMLPTADQMAMEDNSLVRANDNVKDEVAATMTNRVATNADAIPTAYAPTMPAPAPEVPAAPVEEKEEGKDFSCVSFSEVSSDAAVARYNQLKSFFTDN